MSILDYLPTFKVVEINRSTGLVAGHVLSQYKLFEDSALTTVPNSAGGATKEFLENGFILGLDATLVLKAYDATVHAQPFLVFTEEINTYMEGLKYYATPEDSDGDLYPRCIGLFVGDTFTTNNYTTIADATHAKVVAGKLTLQAAADSDTLFKAEESTLPNGGTAYRFTYIGQVVAA